MSNETRLFTPEVYEDFRVMRNTPYGRLTGLHSTEIDYKNVEKVTFFASRPSPEKEWSISDVELLEGEKKLPDAMKMTPEEFFPFIDKYGQFKYAEWPGKVHSDADLQKALALYREAARNGDVEARRRLNR